MKAEIITEGWSIAFDEFNQRWVCWEKGGGIVGKAETWEEVIDFIEEIERADDD